MLYISLCFLTQFCTKTHLIDSSIYFQHDKQFFVIIIITFIYCCTPLNYLKIVLLVIVIALIDGKQLCTGLPHSSVSYPAYSKFEPIFSWHFKALPLRHFLRHKKGQQINQLDYDSTIQQWATSYINYILQKSLTMAMVMPLYRARPKTWFISDPESFH